MTDKIEAIRARHEADDLSGDWHKSDYDLMKELRADRATLLSALDAERAARVEAEGKLAEVREAAGPFVLDFDPTEDATGWGVHVPIDIAQRLSAALKESGHE